MKVILSRKGFDSESGGYASSILPDDRLLSLPIPQADDSTTYSKLKFDNKTYYDLMKELNLNRIKYKASRSTKSERHTLELSTECHLDPDIYPSVIIRQKEWRPLFGQCGIAQQVLDKCMVGEGDIFLFFGLFKKTREIDSKLSFEPTDNARHIIFGYFQIGDIKRVTQAKDIPKWMCYHSHVSRPDKSGNDTIYVARDTLSWNNHLPGAGSFSFNNSLVLTKEGKGYSCSKWQLPTCFQGIEMGYHKPNSWKDGYFQSRARGQEFVIQEVAKIEEWATELINKNAS